MDAEVTAALIVAIAGISGSVAQTVIANRERQRERELHERESVRERELRERESVQERVLRERQSELERRGEYVLHALARFEGGRQERNVGISIIGNVWDEAPEQEGVFVRLLTNQALYIIAEGDPEQAHEFNNLDRIIDLLVTKPRSKAQYATFYEQLVSELVRRREKPDGERVTSPVLSRWIARLQQP